jgi:hypothetical protein
VKLNSKLLAGFVVALSICGGPWLAWLPLPQSFPISDPTRLDTRRLDEAYPSFAVKDLSPPLLPLALVAAGVFSLWVAIGLIVVTIVAPPAHAKRFKRKESDRVSGFPIGHHRYAHYPPTSGAYARDRFDALCQIEFAPRSGSTGFYWRRDAPSAPRKPRVDRSEMRKRRKNLPGQAS